VVGKRLPECQGRKTPSWGLRRHKGGQSTRNSTFYLQQKVAGNLCETGDVFGKEIEMPVPKRGDILAVLYTGAYCKSMASNFNLREIPKEIII